VGRATLIELAVRVLRAAVERARSQRIDGPEVRLALRVVLPHAGDRQLLVEFWSYAGQMHTANRADSCNAVLGSIVEDLRAAGRYPSPDEEARRAMAEMLGEAGAERDAKAQVHRRHYFTPPPRRG
jgi:hypothetical protein